jgi:hypothetical protein
MPLVRVDGPGLGVVLGSLLLLACGGGSETGQVSPTAPVITSFAPTAATITSGTSTYLKATFSGGTGGIDDGVGAITSGVPDSVGPLTANTTYLLTVSGDGGTAAQTATVNVVPPPLAPEIAASPSVMAGGAGYTASVPLQSQTTYQWTIAGGTITQGQGTAEITFNAATVGTLQLLCVAVNAAGTQSDPGTISIEVLPGPVIADFQASPPSLAPGASAVLSWSVTGAGSVTIAPAIGPVAETGSVTVSPGATTIYTLTAAGQDGSVTASATVVVADKPPVIVQFTATPDAIERGQSTTLAWTVQGATQVSLGPDLGPVMGGSLKVWPGGTTTYTLTATNPAGSAVARVEVQEYR